MDAMHMYATSKSHTVTKDENKYITLRWFRKKPMIHTWIIKRIRQH